MSARRPFYLSVAAVGIVILILMLVRIGYVDSNKSNWDYPVEHKQIGEWISLDGVFFGSADEECEGYSIRIDEVHIVTPRVYLSEYGIDQTDFLDDIDNESVIAISYTIHNDGTAQGGISLFEHKLIPSSRNKYYECDVELWNASQPQLNGTMAFSVVPGSEYSFVAPFTLKNQPRYFDSYEKMRREKIVDHSFELVLSNAPKRIVVDIEID